MYDFAIIGSGAGGGVLAHQLHTAGAKCVLLEAGKFFRKETFPRTELEYSPQLFWGGGLEFDTSSKMAFLRGRCVGGTTNLNQCLLDRFDSVAFDDWKRESGVDFFSETGLDPHYSEIENQLHLEKIEARHFNRNTQLFIKGCEKHGFGWAPLRRGQSDCALDQGNDCIGCLGGCHRDSKQSTLVGFIQKAEATGLEIRAEFEVGRIDPTGEGVRIEGLEKGQKTTLQAKQVILAAGAFGSSKILLQSGFGNQLPTLGKNFSSHPQFMSFGLFKEEINAHKGAFQGVKSQDQHFRKSGFKLENVFGPPISIAMLYPRLGAAHQKFMKNYRKMACIEVAVRDEAIGEIRLGAKGKLAIHKPLTQQDLLRRDQGLGVVNQIFTSLGAEEVMPSPYYFGLHLMGGCKMGVEARESVVAPDFRVHGQQNIFVADSSLFPNAPGINPALTIMALAERLASQLKKGV
ncbi:GMC family oxidoreductase [bacterium (Candidatus Blackallbacteria) CG17_big_fil_post_rev_8_21_14_2_50_48_46]|uniref:GMC family oxidoreductase n=1 Tax=bacterium (Candidatus Blackallbacteria) CG17_big_fil_post_rev_8_21_14_2_50_48_46 TaxID=2014261 RepID=A0A2M7GBF3_9BACT|nr:MAG: glucose-methanol-choline oxidoreductase [bacterium (Candidatus Blackallbacteria) CG18_big_fil_WC_8_21_14_2_50_49_26]PIW19522.1 MAG: GMC family oxidoreductase [bacterium (Candidatus Blackallbacteria) CG17_big_fil_post_rev_8_21_14_2_50_48_46]PIW48874.1 MAG: GMC family oxidoreductase [bacterium (Candidatus Blackallbacteria) CG13_big_fil_rev_8_21_14_2_50_49_14]